MKVKFGGTVYDSALLMNAFDTAHLFTTSKGGLKVKLLVSIDNDTQRVVEATRNQLVKLVMSFEDKSRFERIQYEDLNKLRIVLERLDTEEVELFHKMDDAQRKKLASRQKWGNLFFKREQAFKKVTLWNLVYSDKLSSPVTKNNHKDLTLSEFWKRIEKDFKILNSLYYSNMSEESDGVLP